MIHPPGWYWPGGGGPWQVFRERPEARRPREVLLTGVTRAVAEHAAAAGGRVTRHVFMGRLFYAAPVNP